MYRTCEKKAMRAIWLNLSVSHLLSLYIHVYIIVYFERTGAVNVTIFLPHIMTDKERSLQHVMAPAHRTRQCGNTVANHRGLPRVKS